MRIDITHSPYYPEFTAGYVVLHRGQKRKYIVLVRGDGSKACTSYARYLMAERIGRMLSKDEHVDHIDEDKSNDSIDNLQILTQADNIRKNAAKTRPRMHGTSSMYRSGCRCGKCVEYMKRMRNRWYAKNAKEVNEKRREKRADDKRGKNLI